MVEISPDQQYRLQRQLADKITAFAPLDEIRVLLACGAKVNEPVTQGLRPLHYAVYCNYIECVRMLLVRCSEIDAQDEVGYSALHLSAEQGNLALMHLLLENRARVSFVDREREKHLFPRDYKCDEPLRLAVKNEHFECAQLLLEHGAEPNARYFQGSEISFVSPSNTKFLDLLLLYGADPNAYDRDGMTPLMKAARYAEAGLEAAELLIKFGAYVSAMGLEKQDLRTPLHFAVLGGCVETVHLLLEHGARVNMPSDYDKPSVLDLAVLKDQPNLIELLLSRGADPNAVYTYIGSPMHLVCCSNLNNQFQILQMLFDSGGDPNLSPVFSDGARLKSPMVEYIRSTERPDAGVVRLMLSYGGRVIIRSPLHDPRGQLRNLVKVAERCPEVFDLLVDAAEYFDQEAVQRLQLPIEQRMRLIATAESPLTLQKLARLTLREQLKPLKPDKVRPLPVPERLKLYVLY